MFEIYKYITQHISGPSIQILHDAERALDDGRISDGKELLALYITRLMGEGID